MFKVTLCPFVHVHLFKLLFYIVVHTSCQSYMQQLIIPTNGQMAGTANYDCGDFKCLQEMLFLMDILLFSYINYIDEATFK